MALRDGVPWPADMDSIMAEAVADNDLLSKMLGSPQEADINEYTGAVSDLDTEAEARHADARAEVMILRVAMSVATAEQYLTASAHVASHMCPAGLQMLLEMATTVLDFAAEGCAQAYLAHGLDPADIDLDDEL